MKPSTPTKIALGPFSSSPTSSLKRKPQTKVKKLNASPKGKGKKASANSNANSNQTVAIGSSANVNLNQQLTVQANLSHLMSSPEYASPNSSNSDKVRRGPEDGKIEFNHTFLSFAEDIHWTQCEYGAMRLGAIRQQ